MNIILQFRDKWLLLVIGVLYYFLVRLYIGSVDDIMYSYLWTADGIQFGHPIASLADVFSSQFEHYLTMNGRFTNHVLIQYLCGMLWGREAFFILSAVCFPLLIMGLTSVARKISGSSRNVSYEIWTTLVVFLLLCPALGNTMWANVAFTVNYLWTSTAFVWLLYTYLCVREKPVAGFASNALLALFAFWVGTLHEGFSLPLSGFFFIYYICQPKRFRGSVAVLVAFYWLGTCLVAFAPANFARVTNPDYVGTEPFGIKRVVGTLIRLLRSNWMVQLLAMITLVMLVRYKKNREQLMAHSYLWGVSVLSVLFAAVITYLGAYQLLPVALMETIMLVVAIQYCNWRFVKYVLWLAIVPMSLLYIKVYHHRQQLVDGWTAMIASTTPEDAVYADASALWRASRKIPASLVATVGTGYDLHVTNTHYFEMLVSVVATDGKHPDKIKYTLPDSKENLRAMCTEENKIGNYVYDGGDFMVARYPSGKHYQLSYVFPPSWVARLLQKEAQVWTVECDPLNHSFRDGNDCYSVIFIKPTDIVLREEKCEE